MVNGIKTIYPHGLNKGFGSKFRVGLRIHHDTPDEGYSMHLPKRCE